jgi:NAD(P)H-hydrate epimerase
MQQIDRKAIDARSIPSEDLMENAGAGIALRLVADFLPQPETGSVAIFCGKGNNGGDGFVVARHLARAGVQVELFFLGPLEKLSTDARLNFDRAAGTGINLTEIKAIDNLPPILECDLIIDAIFGTGFDGDPRGLAGELIKYINAQAGVTVSIDLPSGLNASDGSCAEAVINADYTYTLAQPKFGLFVSPGREQCGVVEVIPIGIPEEVVDSFDLKIDLTTVELVAEILPVRNANSHKGDFGRLLTIAGSTGMTGAAALSALAGLRSGGGIAMLACPKAVQPVLATMLTEVMTLPLPDVAKNGVLALRGLGEIRQLCKSYDALVLGPGIGRHHETAELIRRLITKLDLTTIIDADGLNAFEGHTDLLRKCDAPLVLTPHPGEFARLTGTVVPPESEIEARAEVAIKAAADFGAIIVLKGSPTLIASNDGRCCLNPSGNDGMATGGSGDVLSGIIGTLLAQKVDPFEAAVAAVFIHGLAGDFAAEDLTPRAMIAGDIIDYLPDAFGLLD